MVEAANRHKKSAGRSIRPPEGVLYSQTTFSIVDGVPQPRRIPLPAVPTFPVLSKDIFEDRGHKPCPSVLVAGKIVPVISGRAAIGLALQHAGIGIGHQVLVPGYHCREMIPPIIAAGCKPVFYKIQKDFSPNWDDIAQKTGPDTKALLAVHYFGFPQKADEIQAFCEENGLIFIEDCAHAFFGSYRDRPLGSYGHYAIASSRKFFPVQDGGLLVISRDRAKAIPRTMTPGLKENLRQLKVGIEKAGSYGRLPIFKPLLFTVNSLQKILQGKAKQTAPVTSEQSPDEMSGYTNDHYGKGLAKVADAIIRRTSFNRAVERRRRNYEILVAELASLPGCSAPFPNLPDGCVPYMFPLQIDHLDRIFPDLEDAAIPMQRFGQFLWDNPDDSTCPVSASYSKNMVQFACHQGLNAEEFEWMTDTVRRILSQDRDI